MDISEKLKDLYDLKDTLDLSDWEYDFLVNVYHQGFNMTDKQVEKVFQIHQRVWP